LLVNLFESYDAMYLNRMMHGLTNVKFSNTFYYKP